MKKLTLSLMVLVMVAAIAVVGFHYGVPPSDIHKREADYFQQINNAKMRLVLPAIDYHLAFEEYQEKAIWYLRAVTADPQVRIDCMRHFLGSDARCYFPMPIGLYNEMKTARRHAAVLQREWRQFEQQVLHLQAEYRPVLQWFRLEAPPSMEWGSLGRLPASQQDRLIADALARLP